MRHAARIDANKTQVVSALKASGAYVYDLKLPVDILCGYKGVTYLIEIKDGDKKKLTKLQENFFNNWTGGALLRVNSPDDALKQIGAIKHDIT
jgi:hypothetical protein